MSEPIIATLLELFISASNRFLPPNSNSYLLRESMSPSEPQKLVILFLSSFFPTLIVRSLGSSETAAAILVVSSKLRLSCSYSDHVIGGLFREREPPTPKLISVGLSFVM